MKRRPACIVSSSAYNDQEPDVMLAMVTSSRNRLQRPGVGDVVLGDWQSAGLLRPSVVRTWRIFAIERRLLTLTLGNLTPTDLAAVDQALKAVLGLP
jgi:mRNA interferase MazF